MQNFKEKRKMSGRVMRIDKTVKQTGKKKKKGAAGLIDEGSSGRKERRTEST